MSAVESCPICHGEYTASDYPPCDKCGKRACDGCRARPFATCSHTICDECDGEDCPACVDSDAERDEVLDVIRRG